MPTYEYRCNGCLREFEYQQRMADDDLVKCEVCGEDKLEKLISWTAFGSTSAGLYSSNPTEAIKVDRGRPPKQEPKPPPAAVAPEPPAPEPPTPAPPAAPDDPSGEPSP